MLCSKFIQIDFADSRICAMDAIHDLRKAAEYAGLNLYSRYDVQLQCPMLSDTGKVVVEIKIPEEIADSFAIGNHLRGISSYLLKNCGGRYNQYLVGNRLLNYNEIPKPSESSEKLSMADRLEAVAAFARLLERCDDEASDQINRIMAILSIAE